MQPHEIEQLCRGVVPGKGSVDVLPLGAGLIRETYRIARDGAAYALKVPAEHRPSLGLDFAWEVRVLERAGNAGVAPPVVYCDAERGILIARWMAGRSWSAQEAAAPENLGKIAALLHRVHALGAPAPPRIISPQSWADLYCAALPSRPAQLTDPELSKTAAARGGELAKLPRANGVICHSDLHAMNLIQDGAALVLLDWEYAHVADPLWDLAGWSANNDFEAQSQWTLLTNYLGAAPAPSEWLRLRLLLWLYDYVCLLWSRLYLSVRGDGSNGVSERARLLDARLHIPAHYAA